MAGSGFLGALRPLARSLIQPLRSLRKERQRAEARRFLSAVRRIERVAPPRGRRVVAMTFDDGPAATPAVPGDGTPLTEAILRVLERYGARGTFDVIGSTAAGYPDEQGAPGTVYWSGVRYDHYPAFGRDAEGGAEAQPGLIRRILEAGHELANHSYSHIAFGPARLVYGRRAFLPGFDACVADVRRLHQLILERHGYAMRFGRPPHYIDPTADGRTAYDVYAAVGYQYLAASFDGGGWLPSTGDYARDVRRMVEPLERALAADPEALNGRIIFEKDGYDQSLQSPVADGLPAQLELLRRHGYEVIPVRELLELSAFADVAPEEPVARAARALLDAGHPVAYRDNSLQPERKLSLGELLRMAVPLARTPGAPATGPAFYAAAARQAEVAAPARRAFGDPAPGGEWPWERRVRRGELSRFLGIAPEGLPGSPEEEVTRGEALLALAARLARGAQR
ncbi:MAG: polysaccharide deacetylase family protein [Bacillota bacterium]|nr:polysaccharide deacetylase family protein [Bacillota bacterium]